VIFEARILPLFHLLTTSTEDEQKMAMIACQAIQPLFLSMKLFSDFPIFRFGDKLIGTKVNSFCHSPPSIPPVGLALAGRVSLIPGSSVFL
jgi:hypothetical protein